MGRLLLFNEVIIGETAVIKYLIFGGIKGFECCELTVVAFAFARAVCASCVFLDAGSA